MKTRLFIAACFLTVIILKPVPYRSSDRDTTIINFSGVQSNLVTFSIFCLLFLTVLILTTIIHLKKPLQGNLIINRQDLNLKNELTGIAFWTVFVLTSMLLARDFLVYFKGTASYFFVILACVLLYDLILKWLVRQNRPNYLSINNDMICLKRFFSRGERKIAALKMVSYETKQNAILFSFQEGLDNFKLYLTDYDSKDIDNLINTIKNIKGEEIIIGKNINKRFPHNI